MIKVDFGQKILNKDMEQPAISRRVCILPNNYEARYLSVVEKSDITVRPVKARDFVLIKQITANSFPIPKNWTLRKDLTGHYEVDFPRNTQLGQMHVIVAENTRNKVAGYAYYQFRQNGDMYLRELAAQPHDKRDKVPLAGTLLLGAALKHALFYGCVGQATLNIHRPDRYARLESENPGKEWDLVRYYEKWGYRVQPNAVGYRSDGSNRRNGDIWMVADIAYAGSGVIQYLECNLSG